MELIIITVFIVSCLWYFFKDMVLAEQPTTLHLLASSEASVSVTFLIEFKDSLSWWGGDGSRSEAVCTCSREVERGDCCSSAHFLIYSVQITAQRLMLPTFGAALPTPVSLI